MQLPIDSFQACLAFGPVAVYLLAVGLVNFRRRPTVVSGALDVALLGLAIVGLIMIGPMEIFFPESAALYFLGPLVWLPLLALYGLGVALVLLSLRPRLVVYNVSMDALRRTLADVVGDLDPEARWAGDSLFLPRLGVQLHMDAFGLMRNVSLVANGSRQSPLGWLKLHRALAKAIRGSRTSRNVRGLVFALAGFVLIGLLICAVAQDPAATVQAMHEMFRV
ncbi:MAG: hypothetical protein JW888_05155 [Pirellulales bacterium]|nr:hypothetical protein [Pirellulales bacterium]